MITDDKIKEVRKMLRSGVPPGEVEEDLRKQGYSQEDIRKVFPAHKYDMSSYYLFFAIILLLIGIWLFLDRGSLLVLILSGLLFLQYFRETQRVAKNKKST